MYLNGYEGNRNVLPLERKSSSIKRHTARHGIVEPACGIVSYSNATNLVQADTLLQAYQVSSYQILSPLISIDIFGSLGTRLAHTSIQSGITMLT